MKKLSIYLFLFVFVLLPFKAFAAVDITLEDESTTTQKSISVLVNSGTDEAEKISLQIQASSDVVVSSVADDSTICSAFDYTNVSNLVTITCTFAEAKVLDGYIATILFDSTSADYTFTVSKTTGLDLGTLTLGTVTDIAGATDTTSESEITADSVGTTETTTTTESTTKSFQDIFTDYLPYILIGGATILLISILGILLSKKKGPKTEDAVIPVQEIKEEAPAPSENRPTDIDNISGNLYSPTVKEETIQEKLEEQPVQLQSAEAPSEAIESNDLADLMSKDSSPVQEEVSSTIPEQITPSPDFNAMPVETPTPVIDETTPVPDFNAIPTETLVPIAEETTQTMPSNLPDMQEMVNNGAVVAPGGDTTPTEEPQSVPPVQTTF